LFKFTDGSGRLLALRADNTAPIARLAAAKFKGQPVKLFYNQHIFRAGGGYSGKRCEILESGVELIGYGGETSDLLCSRTAISALERLSQTYSDEKKPRYLLELGNASFADSLFDELDIQDDEEIKDLRASVNSKNLAALGIAGKKNEKAMEKIRLLPMLYGGGEKSESVFERASELADGNEKAQASLASLRKIYDSLCSEGLKDSIAIDLGIVHTLHYYTGIVFRGYIEGAGEPLLLGGRYDELCGNFGNDLPAIGFSVNLSLAAQKGK
jgi:ATP phosphoribosyltransferase regulatory subunit